MSCKVENNFQENDGHGLSHSGRHIIFLRENKPLCLNVRKSSVTPSFFFAPRFRILRLKEQWCLGHLASPLPPSCLLSSSCFWSPQNQNGLQGPLGRCSPFPSLLEDSSFSFVPMARRAWSSCFRAVLGCLPRVPFHQIPAGSLPHFTQVSAQLLAFQGGFPHYPYLKLKHPLSLCLTVSALFSSLYSFPPDIIVCICLSFLWH